MYQVLQICVCTRHLFCMYQPLLVFIRYLLCIYQVLFLLCMCHALISYVSDTYYIYVPVTMYVLYMYILLYRAGCAVLLFIIRCVCTQFIEPVKSEEVLTPHSFFLYTQGRGTECGRASPYPRDLLDLRSSLGELQYNHFPVPFHNIQLSSSKNFLIIKYIVNRQDLLGYLFNFISIVHICVKKKFKTQNINPCLKPK